MVLAAHAVSLSASGLQSPHAAWRTLRTAHYRIHYPPMLADWAGDVASRIEGIHGAVVALVGYESPRPVQVVLADPMEEPNGMAVPLLPYPYVVLWHTEPRSDDLHGNALSSWTEELVSHEITHIHHLMRPRRAPTVLRDLFGLPVGPLVLKCPRWVMEGYATLAEGRITGAGRPHSPLRAALLRQWAAKGKLPAYEELDGAPGFLGGDMAYLVGSAYLEWLERQRPAQPGVLRNLWKQIASRRNRSFDAAFLATFGFGPRDGYQRFQAEASHDALEWESRIKALGPREGEPLLRAAGTLRDLEVSPDDGLLLASLEAPSRSGLLVWDLRAEPPPPWPGKPDPLNAVEDVPPEMPDRRTVARLPLLNHRMPQKGQWVDRHTIRFLIKHADSEGSLHRRPALWRLGDGVDLAPSRAPAPRYRTLEPLHRDGGWVLEWDGQRLPLPGQAVGTAFVDEPRRLVWAACDWDGTVDIVQVPYTLDGDRPQFGKPRVATRTASAAWNPAPSPDGKWLYFTTLDPEGMVVRRLDLGLPPLETPPAPEPRILSPGTVLPPPATRADLPRAAELPPSTPYNGAENGWIQVASGASLTPSGESFQVGLSGSDLLGRLSWLAMAGFGDAAGPRGAVAGVSSTAWAWNPSLLVFSDEERPSRQRFLSVQADRRRQGFEAAATWEDRGDTPWWLSPVAASERVERPDGPEGSRSRSLLGVRSGFRGLWARGPWGITAYPSLQAYAGRTAGEGATQWTNLRADLALRAETPVLPLTLRAAAGRIGNSGGGAFPEAYHLGGVTTSLVPQSLDSDLVEEPALPAFLATGTRFARWRAEAGGTVRAYLEGTSLWDPGQARMPFLRVAGLEGTLANPAGALGPSPLRRLRLQVGVHRILDGTFKDRTVATFTLVVRP